MHPEPIAAFQQNPEADAADQSPTPAPFMAVTPRAMPAINPTTAKHLKMMIMMPENFQ
jgi:hypothetical protein